MLDIKVIRSNPEKVKQSVKNRNGNLDAEIDKLLAIDEERRVLLGQAENMKAQQNAASKKIPQIKKEGGDISAIMTEMKKLSEDIKNIDSQLCELEETQKNIVLMIPNIPHESVPIGTDDSQNKEIRTWG